MKYQEQNSKEIKEIIEKVKVAILPLGAVEAHGPHLPLGTDNYLSERIAEKLSENVECLVFPTLPYGQVWSLEEFPGSVSLSNETLINMLYEIGKSMYKNGFKIFGIINGHLGNGTAIKEAQRKLFSEFSDFKTFNFFYTGTDKVIQEVRETQKLHKNYFHADELETSYMLYLADEYVEMSKAINGNPDYPEYIDIMPVRWTEFTDTAVMGDATLATKEKGKKIVDTAVKNMSDIIKKTLEEIK